MKRELWIHKIEKIIGRVERGAAPARIREIYVFGSFARGAPEPGDLDLIVVHDPPTDEILAPLKAGVSKYSFSEVDRELKAFFRFQAALRKVFRRGSDRRDVMLGANPNETIRLSARSMSRVSGEPY